MTHEAGIEAAATIAFDYSGDAFYPKFGIDTSEYVSRIIQAYLSASGMVLADGKPKAFFVKDFADGFYLTKSLVAAERSDHYFEPLHPIADPFKSKP